MDIHHLTSFLRPFTNLEDLSLLDPRVLFGPMPEYPSEPLSTKGRINLELRIDTIQGGRSFVNDLSLLPVAVRIITLSEPNSPTLVPWNDSPCMTEINKLLTASRETLACLRIRASEFPHHLKLTRVSDRARNSRLRLGYRSGKH